MPHEGPVEPFDEDAALAELERLRESIQAARQERQRKSDEFDAFVQSFRTPAAPASEQPVATSGASEAPHQAAGESISRPPQAREPLPSIDAVPPDIGAPDETTAPARPQVSRRHRIGIRPLGVGAIIAVIALGFLANRSRKQTSPPARVNTVTNNHVATAHGDTPTPAVPRPTATPPAAAHAVVLELRTVRAVWIRVVVDGRKNVEGMVQAGESLHFSGDHSIVVRVGNGGDVLVKTGDREERFGEVGQPITRTFLKP